MTAPDYGKCWNCGGDAGTFAEDNGEGGFFECNNLDNAKLLLAKRKEE